MSAPSPESVLLTEGLDHHRAGRLDPARQCYARILAHDPENADAQHLLGLVAHAEGAHAEAVAYLQRAVALRPDVAHFHGNLGIARLAAGDHSGAERCFHAVLEHEPENDDAWNNLGLALLHLGRAGDAEPCFAAAIAIAPHRADAIDNLATCEQRRGDDAARAGLGERAEAHYRAALRQRPEHHAALTNYGNLLSAQGRFVEAVSLLRRAAARTPDSADAHHNIAACLVAAGRLEEAEAEALAALRRDPNHADANYTLGTVRLLDGKLSQGLAGLEWRWRRRGFTNPRPFRHPQWDGRPLGGKTLLLHAEQGLGDAIQMLRFVPEVASLGRVLLEVPPPLRRLAGGFASCARVFATGDSLPAFDIHCPLPSLPLALDMRLDTIPADVPYLQPSAADTSAWRRRLAGLDGLRVGLAWAGNPDYAADARRSIAPERLGALRGLHGVTFVSLQPGAPPPAGLALFDRTAELHDLADTAALIVALDLVVSVDTAVAHLAGALGRPVWLLNRFDTCWRWLLGRNDSPWYPTLRQFRQTRPGDWDDVLARVRDELVAYARVAGRRDARKFAM